MSQSDLSALSEDIATHGLRQAITTLDGSVLDGWHRYQACLVTKEAPRFVEYDGDDPVAFVLSLNMSRRHLTGSQRAAAVVACSEWKPAGRPAPTNSAPGSEMLAERADVSTRTIEHAKAAHRGGLGDAVRDNKVSAKRGAEIAKLPAEERAAALETKPTKKPVDSGPEEIETPLTELEAERMADLAADFEAMSRIVEADDRLSAAWAECKTLAAKYADLERLFDAKCGELAIMTKEAKRWRRKFESLEKGVVS